MYCFGIVYSGEITVEQKIGDLFCNEDLAIVIPKVYRGEHAEMVSDGMCVVVGSN